MSFEIGPFREKQGRGLTAGPCGNLEIAFWAPADALPGIGEHVAVVCHPHPLHGGNMDNKVVTTLVRTYRDLGVPVATFNFRGVGASDGGHDNGVGEVEDLISAVDWITACYPGRSLLLAGFSFGSAVAANASYRLTERLRHLVLVAPPVERYIYDRDNAFPSPLLVIIGDDDELVDVAGVAAWQKKLESPSSMLRYPQTSHFFHGKLGVLKKDLAQALTQELSQ